MFVASTSAQSKKGEKIEATLSCPSAKLNPTADGFLYTAEVRVDNPRGGKLSDVTVQYSDGEILGTISKLKPGESDKIDLSGTSLDNPVRIQSIEVIVKKVDYDEEYKIQLNEVVCPSVKLEHGLELTKECETKLAPMKATDDGTMEGKVYITGTVTNTGSVDLKDVVVTDDDGFTWEFPYINAGESLYFSRSIKIHEPLATNFTDTVTAEAKSVLDSEVKISSKPVTAVCEGLNIKPSMQLEKECKAILIPSGNQQEIRVNYTATLTNTGNVDLRNVKIIDDAGTPDDASDDITHGPFSIKVGEHVVVSGQYKPKDVAAADHSNSVRATADTVVAHYPSIEAQPVMVKCAGVEVSPSLLLTKECIVQLVESKNSQNDKSVQVSYHGTVTNNGDITLINVIVTDDAGTPGDTTDDITHGPFTLAPGQSESFDGSYIPDDGTQSEYTDSVIAKGDNMIVGLAGYTTKPVVAKCMGIKPKPSLVLTKTCEVSTRPHPSNDGSVEVIVIIEGTVRNAGDIDLRYIKVTDDDGFEWNFDYLAAGQSASFNRTIVPEDQTAESFQDTVSAVASMVAGLGNISAAAPVTAVCKGKPIKPEITLEKQCRILLESIKGEDANMQHVVVHFYGTLTNTGDSRVRNIMVIDDAGTPDDTSDDHTFGPYDLNPGESVNFEGSYLPGSPMDESFKDTVTASGEHLYHGFPAVVAAPQSAICKRPQVNQLLELQKICSVSLVNDPNSGLPRLQISAVITVHNMGNVNLRNIVVIDDMGTPDDDTDDVTHNAALLAAGASTQFQSNYFPKDQSAESFSDTVTATAEAGINGWPAVNAGPVTASCKGIKFNPKLALAKRCVVLTEDSQEGNMQNVVISVEGSVTNTGDILLTNIVITDDIDGFKWEFDRLEVGETKTFTRKMYPADPTSEYFNDTITATASPPAGLGESISASPVTASCKGIKKIANLALTKECVVERQTASEEDTNMIVVRFKGDVTNTGDADLVNIVITDDNGTPDDTSDDQSFGPFDLLRPGESKSFNGEYHPTDISADYHTDTVTATADHRIKGFPGASASPVSATCKGIKFNPQLSLTKVCQALLQPYPNSGDEREVVIQYQGFVSNTGDLPLSNIIVTDDSGTPNDTSDDITHGPFNLLPGQRASFSGSYLAGNPTSDLFMDTVTATASTGIKGLEDIKAEPVSATCKGVKVHPALILTKRCVVDTEEESDHQMYVRVDIYGTVTNSGDIELHDVLVTDDDGFSWNIGTILPGQTRAFNRSVRPEDSTAASYSDTIVATGRLPGRLGSINAQPVNATCQNIAISPALALTKVCTATLVDYQDSKRRLEILFSGTVRNTGNVRLLNVSVIDDMGTPSDASDDLTFGPFDLLPGQSRPFSGRYIPADPSLEYFTDRVRAFGDVSLHGYGRIEATEVEARCQGIKVAPNLALNKTCYVQLVTENNMARVKVFFSGSVMNTGNVHLLNVRVIDDMGTPDDTSDDLTFGPFSLAPSESRAFSGSHYPAIPNQEYYEDRVTASADNSIEGFPGVELVNASAKCAGISVTPELSLEKECYVDTIGEAGNRRAVRINVLVTIENTGNIDLLSIRIMDDDGFTWDIATLAEGERRVLTRTVIPTDPTAEYFEDTITATAVAPAGLGNVTAGPITARCVGISVRPELTLSKECVARLVDLEDGSQTVIIRYNGTATNTGNVTLINVLVRDDMGTPDDLSDDLSYGPFVLVAGESVLFYGEYYPSSNTGDSFSDTLSATADNLYSGFAGVLRNVSATCQGIISAPKLELEKQCTVLLEDLEDGSEPRVIVRWNAIIRNSGDVALRNVRVIDDMGTPNDTSDDALFGPWELLPGRSMSFFGHYYPEDSTADLHRDTLTAFGENIIKGHPNATALPVTAECKGIVRRGELTLTKRCAATLEYSGDGMARILLLIEGTVRNTGDIALYDVVVTDDDGFSWTIGYLPIGQMESFSRRLYPTMSSNMTSFTDTIVGTARLPAGLGSITSSEVSATCQPPAFRPELKLEKECETQLIHLPEEEGSLYGQQMIRVSYSGRVINTGDIHLIDVLVIDDRGTPDDTSDDITHGPFSLAPGAYETFSGSYLPLNSTDSIFSDTVTATGRPILEGLAGAVAAPVTAECEGIGMRNPSLALTKNCTAILEPSGIYRRVRIEFFGRIENDGDAILVNVLVEDDMGTPDDASDDLSFGPYTLRPGEFATFYGHYYPANFSLEDLSFTDRVTATGLHIVQDFPAPLMREAEAICRLEQRIPRLVLTKECRAAISMRSDAMGSPAVRVDFNGTLSNLGEVAVFNIIITDDKGTPADTSDDFHFGPFNLLPGQSVRYASFYFLSDAAAPIPPDTVSAVGDHEILGFPRVVAESASAECELRREAYPPEMTLTKECYVALAHSGDDEIVTVYVTGSVRNSGLIALRNITITDDDGFTWTFPALEIGEYRNFSRTYPAADPLAAEHNDTITGTADAILGLGLVTATPVTARCAGISRTPALELLKTCIVRTRAISSGPYQGREEIYIYFQGSVTNRGDVRLLDVFVYDDAGTPSDLSDDQTFGPFSLFPGDSASFEGTHLPPSDSISSMSYSDTVYATGRPSISGYASIRSSNTTATCERLPYLPAHALEKECVVRLEPQPDGSHFVIVRYNGRVTNTGNVTLVNVMVVDQPALDIHDASPMTFGPFTLLPGQSAFFSGSYRPLSVNETEYSDTLTATSEHIIHALPGPAPVSATAHCRGVPLSPALTLEKECMASFDGSSFDKYVRILYRGWIINSGNVALRDVLVTDDHGTPDDTTDDVTHGPYTLYPSERRSFSGYFRALTPAAEFHRDTVTATGTPLVPDLSAVLATPVTAECRGVQARPSLRLTKECLVDSTLFEQESDIIRHVRINILGSVMNDGDIPLHNVTVLDDDGFSWTIGSLDVGEIRYFNRTLFPDSPTDASFSDTISASGDAILGLGRATSPEVTATCRGLAFSPALRLEKECIVKTVPSGHNNNQNTLIVEYTGRVRNTGNVPLMNVTVIDDKGTADDTSDDIIHGPFAVLNPGQFALFQGSYTPSSFSSGATYSDTVRASGESIYHGFPGATASPVTANCKALENRPLLSLKKVCRVILEHIDNEMHQRVRVEFTGTLRNEGNVQLNEVNIRDDAGTPDDASDDLFFGPFTLIPGETRIIHGYYYPLSPAAETFEDTMHATANNSFVGFQGASVEASATCRGIVTRPQLQLYKECEAEMMLAPDHQPKTRSHLPARIVLLSFRGWVMNNGDIPLRNVTVIDDHGTPSDPSDDLTFGPFDLARGERAMFEGSYPAPMPSAEYFNNTVIARGDSALEGFPGAVAQPVTARCAGLKFQPAMILHKECEAFLYDLDDHEKEVRLRITGYALNTGDIDIENITVVDDDGFSWFLDDLGVGEMKEFSREVIPTDPTSERFTDTITATASAILGFGDISAAPVTAECEGIKVFPELTLEKECRAQLVENTDYHLGNHSQRVAVFWEGKITNTGDIRLTDIFVTDDMGTPSDSSDDITHGPFDLLPDEVAYLNGTYYPENPLVNYFMDTLSARGKHTIRGFEEVILARNITARCQAILAQPILTLEKDCEAILRDMSDNPDQKQIVVTYSGRVINDGLVTLINVYVRESHDSADDNDVIIHGPYTLRPGEYAEFSGEYLPSSPTDLTFRDTVSAYGDIDILGYGQVYSIENVTAVCRGFKFNPLLELNKKCEVRITKDDKLMKLLVHYEGSLQNKGDVRLWNITIRDDKGTPDDLSDDDFFGPLHLDAGEIYTFEGEYFPCQNVTDEIDLSDIKFRDTVVASAEHGIYGFAAPELATASAVCRVCVGDCENACC